MIDQAKGILMAEERCDADRAFEILRIASQHRNTKLRDVVADIVAGASKPATQPTARQTSTIRWRS